MNTMEQPSAILCLGGGFAQLALIEQIVRAGHRCIVADDRPNIPAARVAHEILPASRHEACGLEPYIRLKDITGVVSGGSDRSVLAMSEIAVAFGLPTYVKPEIAALPTAKDEMRRHLQSAGVRVPRAVAARSEGELVEAIHMVGFPAVIKPSDGIGQSGVNRVDGSADVADAFEKAVARSRSGIAIVEEFLEGPEVGVNGLIVGGVFHLLSVSERNAEQSQGTSFGVAYSKRTPARCAAAYLDEIGREVGKAAASFRMNFGPIYSQVKLTPRGPVIIEIMPRLGGGEDPRMVRLATGVDTCLATIWAALGRGFSLRDVIVGSGNQAVVMEFLRARPGVVREIRGLEQARAVPKVCEVIVYTNPGDRIVETATSADRLGVVIAAADLQEAQAAADTATTCIGFLTVT